MATAFKLIKIFLSFAHSQIVIIYIQRWIYKQHLLKAYKETTREGHDSGQPKPFFTPNTGIFTHLIFPAISSSCQMMTLPDESIAARMLEFGDANATSQTTPSNPLSSTRSDELCLLITRTEYDGCPAIRVMLILPTNRNNTRRVSFNLPTLSHYWSQQIIGMFVLRGRPYPHCYRETKTLFLTPTITWPSTADQTGELELLDVDHCITTEDDFGFVTKDFVKPTGEGKQFITVLQWYQNGNTAIPKIWLKKDEPEVWASSFPPC